MHENNLQINFLPIHVINPRADKEKTLATGEELEQLIDTIGGKVVDRIIQRLDNPNNATFVGKGKVEEIAGAVKDKKVDVVVLNNAAKSKQVHNLKTALQKVNPQIEVWDRVDLILHIFDKHAVSKESKLQIELAKMKYMGPRIYGMGFILSRQGGGIGTSGIGETNTELMKRHWRTQMKKVNDELKKLGDDKENRIERRKREGFKTVSIVGYTNAGKSSLFNLLSGRDVLVENALFATLDSSVGEVYFPKLGKKVLITDTIGFIRNLPPHLINAFKSTLLESIHADVIVHLVDGSDPEAMEKIRVVESILNDLRIDRERVIYVFNKSDLTAKEKKSEIISSFHEDTPIFISVKDKVGIELLLEKIAEKAME